LKKNLLLSILFIVCLTGTACLPRTGTTSTESFTTIQATKPTNVTRTLTVLAAASLTESFTEIGKLFEEKNNGVMITFNFAGSQTLAEQLNQGAKADVFASANDKYMTAAINAQRVNKEDVKTFALNKLVVILPKDNPAKLSALEDLAKPGVKLDLADISVPVGQYSQDFLDKASANTRFGKSFKTQVLKNAVSFENNVKAVVTKVSLGEADAGIVYFTDITAEAAQKLDTLAIPDDLNVIATYPISVISDSQNANLARAFVEFVMSIEGQTVLTRYGFSPAANN